MSNDKLKTLGVATAVGALLGTSAAPWAAAHGGAHFINHGHEYSSNKKAILGSLRHAGKHQIGLTTVGAMMGAAAGGWHLYDEHKRELKKKEKEERMRYKESLKMSKEAGYLSSIGRSALRGGAESAAIGATIGLLHEGGKEARWHARGWEVKPHNIARTAGRYGAYSGLVGGVHGAYKGVIGEYKKNRERKHGNLDGYNSGDIDSAGPKQR